MERLCGTSNRGRVTCGGALVESVFTTDALTADCSVSASYVSNTFSLSVTKTGNGSGAVSSNFVGITCGTNCSADYVNGQSVSLTATPANDSIFTGWSGADCSGTGNCVVSMSATQSVTADFGIISTLSNIATRGRVETGDNVMIAGFIIGGSTAKTVLIRARGPSMAAYGVPNLLANPVLNLYSGSNVIASNDNWVSASNSAVVQATGMAPTDAQEAAIMVTLNPGPYTAIVTGYGNTSGIGIVEVIEIDNLTSPLVNIATRGPVQTGDSVMIAGFIINGSTPQTVLIRARGPSMAAYGVPNLLTNPVLNLYSGSTVIASNDDWGSAVNASAIAATGMAPTNSLESAILITLNPGPYTAIVTGAGGTSGVAIVEVLAQ